MKANHMFRTIAIVSSLLPSLAVAGYDMAFVNEKVAPLATKISAIPKHLLMADDITELLASPEFQELRAKCTTDWQQIAGNIISACYERPDFIGNYLINTHFFNLFWHAAPLKCLIFRYL